LHRSFAPLITEGAGNAGRLMRPQPRVQMKKAHERSHHGHTRNNPAFPAQWLYGLLRALPGDHACLTPSPARLHADLTPALGRQNHTTSPYVAGRARLARCRVHRIPRSTSVTIAKRPSEEAGPNGYSADLPPPSSEILKIRNRCDAATNCFAKLALRRPVGNDGHTKRQFA
jgi:hypothetical protein